MWLNAALKKGFMITIRKNNQNPTSKKKIRKLLKLKSERRKLPRPRRQTWKR